VREFKNIRDVEVEEEQEEEEEKYYLRTVEGQQNQESHEKERKIKDKVVSTRTKSSDMIKYIQTIEINFRKHNLIQIFKAHTSKN
jgi:hypothetical protein